MITLKNTLACVLVLAGISIKPQDNEVTNEEFEALQGCKDFTDLTKDNKIFVVINEDESKNPVEIEPKETEPKETEPTKMKIADLHEYAIGLGIEIPEGAKKDEIIKLIDMVKE